MVLPGYLSQAPIRYADDHKSATAKSAVRHDAEEVLPPRQSVPKPQRGLLGPASRILKGVNHTVLQLRDGLTEEQRAAKTKKEDRRRILALLMKSAETTEQWRRAARELDVLEDNEAWKFDTTTPDFNAPLIQARLEQMDAARANRDIQKMLLLVRTELSRDLGGMSNIKLYKRSYVGTKDLIERYIDSTLATIRALVETSRHSLPDGLEVKDILEQVLYARQAFGRSALLLSGGATFGMNHVGVLKALYEEKLLPRIISGASAGSIVCAVLCTRTDEEIPAVLDSFPYGDLAVFEEENREDSVLDRVRRLLTQGAWIDINHLIRVMQGMLGNMTFQEAYNRTRRILNICVSSASIYELPRLLNYVTAPNVMIWSAVAASCSVPVLFSATQLLVRNPLTGESTTWNPTPQRWIDGSVDNDLPMNRLAEMFNVNHFIVSQVNPHVVPFLAKDDEAIAMAAQIDPESGPGMVYTLANLAKGEALHRMHMLAELGIFPNLVTKARSILSQKYSGDITILPEVAYDDFSRILKNPTSDFMIRACLSGERATWPRLSRIRNHCAVELELDAAVQTLRARVVFGPSHIDLRRITNEGCIHLTKRAEIRRRDSGSSAIRGLITNEEDVDGIETGQKSNRRPPLRSTSSHRIARPQMLQPTPAGPTSSPSTPLPSDAPEHSLQLPEVSSAGETSFSPPTSDADVDSHTDESSLETDIGGSTAAGLGLYSNSAVGESPSVLDLFSRNQPITPSSDHVLATSPFPPSRPSLPSLSLTPDPGLGEKRAKSLPTPEGLHMKPSQSSENGNSHAAQ